jgi:hypothetical protein
MSCFKVDKIYCILGGEIIEIGTESCYKPDEDGKFMVHLSKYGYEFFILNKTAFYDRSAAVARL